MGRGDGAERKAMWRRGDVKGQSTWQSRVIHASGWICQKHSFVTRLILLYWVETV